MTKADFYCYALIALMFHFLAYVAFAAYHHQTGPYYSLIGTDGQNEAVLDYNQSLEDCEAAIANDWRDAWGSRVQFYCAQQPERIAS